MKKIFDIVDQRVILNENCLLIPQFRNVIEKYEDKALDVLSFIYFYCDYKSPFCDYDEPHREETLMEMFNSEGDFTLEDVEVIEAMELYNQLQWTAPMELLQGAKAMLRKMGQYLKHAQIRDDSKDGGNIMAINNVMKSIGSNLASYDELMAQVEKETQKTSVRGGKHVSKRER
jgi:hypothetical protein